MGAASFIQETQELLRRVKRENLRGPQPKGTTIFSLDMVAMYRSLPMSRAPGWVEERCRALVWKRDWLGGWVE